MNLKRLKSLREFIDAPSGRPMPKFTMLRLLHRSGVNTEADNRAVYELLHAAVRHQISVSIDRQAR